MSALSDLEDQVVAMCIDAQLRTWTPDELEQVRQRASTFLRMLDLRYALKREPLPIERGRRHV